MGQDLSRACLALSGTTSCSSIQAMNFTGPPQWVQVSMSILNARLSRCAQVVVYVGGPRSFTSGPWWPAVTISMGYRVGSLCRTKARRKTWPRNNSPRAGRKSKQPRSRFFQKSYPCRQRLTGECKKAVTRSPCQVKQDYHTAPIPVARRLPDKFLFAEIFSKALYVRLHSDRGRLPVHQPDNTRGFEPSSLP